MEHGITHSRSQGLIDAAFEFARIAHAGQVRKYTGEPYITHPVTVAKLVASVTDDCEMIAAAFLHDVIEDCGVTPAALAGQDLGFGPGIARLVVELTDISVPSDGNRARRKDIDRQHLAAASPRAKTIKLADLIDNSASIIAGDPRFASVYMAEKVALLSVLGDGDPTLFRRAMDIAGAYYRDTGQDND